MSESNKNDSFTNKLKGYQNKLLQLGKANRCVCLSRLYNKHNFDLARLLESHSKEIDELIQQSFKRKKPICILPDSDFSEEADKMRRHLKDLARNIKQLEDETGSQYCYFGFPFLEGHLNKEQYVRGPLILFPISVYHGRGGTSEKSAGWHVKFSDSAPILNHTLFAALEKIGGYKMNETLESDFENIWSPSEGTTSPESEEGLIEKISELLGSNGLPLETNDETNSTLIMKNITKDEIELIEPKILKIKNYKIIGSFPQGESAIYQDYENLISKIENGDKNKFIADILGETDSLTEFVEDSEDTDLEDLDSVRDMDLNLILPSDSSQDQIVLSSQNRKITLVRGPPGTGKSQVIVNIISNALAKRQKVLVVCQKRAALEVVHQRLGEKNLDRYTVLLNKEKEDRAKMYLQLKQILEIPNDSKPEQKQKLESTSDEIDELIKKHSEIAHALSKKYFDGITIRDLYTKTSSDFSRQLELDAIGEEITFPELGRLLNKLSQIEENFKKFEGKNHPWRNRRDFSQKKSSDKTKINKILSDIVTNSKNYVILSDIPNQDTLIELVSKYSHLNNTQAITNENIKKFTESVEKISTTNNTSIPFENLKEQIQCVDAGKRLWDKCQDYELINQIKNNHIREDTKEKQIEILDIFSGSAEKKSFWKKLRDQETKRKEKLKKDFEDRVENSGKTSEKLKIMLENGLELWNIAQDLSQKEYVFSKSFVLPDKNEQGYLLDNLKSLNQNRIEFEKNSEELQSIIESLHDIFKKYELFFDKNEDISQLISKANNGKSILDNIDSFAEFVNDDEIQMIKSKISNPQELSSHIQNLYNHLDDFDQLQSHDIRKSDLDSTQQSILNQCLSKIDLEDKWTNIIEQEIYHYWIEKIEHEHQILKAGHFDDYKENQSRLASLLEEKSKLLVDEIIHSIESNSDFRPGTGSKRTQREIEYNELNHELGKKRRVKSVRKLIEQYEQILFDITPCWLASPEMVSNIFPLEQNMFDLVIVDEASQLAVERALPFLYRGEKIIIAGDEKQLKPHDLFQIKEEDSEEEEYDGISDIESLLVLSKRRYPSNTLQWHYRSKWQELIDFSNHAFYHGVLQISPNVQLKAPKPPIEWVECSGLWENRSNIAEAAKVVDTVYEILQDYKHDKPPTIGIITFNDQQRNIIMDEIENRQKKDPAFDELYKKIEMPESGKKDEEIFVRNIENVQGDERDIIIFSVGYAKDPEGKFRLQFGTLNQDGGENRLNVAITRASQKIIVVCSIDLQDMKVEGTKNPGPKRLKDFLIYAKAVSEGDNETVERILESLGSGMSNIQQKEKSFDSDFEEQVYDGLVRLGYNVDTQVGQSGYRIDLAVVHPNDSSKYILGVECDGAMFHSGKSVRERDVMRQKFLERRGWSIDRIWSRKWWINKDKEIQRIHEKIESLVQN